MKENDNGILSGTVSQIGFRTSPRLVSMFSDVVESESSSVHVRLTESQVMEKMINELHFEIRGNPDFDFRAFLSCGLFDSSDIPVDESTTKEGLSRIIFEHVMGMFPDFDKDRDFRDFCGRFFEERRYFYNLRNILYSLSSGYKWYCPKGFNFHEMALVLCHVYGVRGVDFVSETEEEAEANRGLHRFRLCVYDESMGIYVAHDGRDGKFEQFVHAACYDLPHGFDDSARPYVKSVCRHLMDMVPIVLPTRDPDLVPVGNGIFDYKNRVLLPFSPDFVFFSKSRVDYVPDAEMPAIPCRPFGSGSWDPESWMESLSGDPETVDFLWRVMNMALRPYAYDSYVVWMGSLHGRAGRRTFLQVLDSLCPGGIQLMPADQMKDRFVRARFLSAGSHVWGYSGDAVRYLDGYPAFDALVDGNVMEGHAKYGPKLSRRMKGMFLHSLYRLPRVRNPEGALVQEGMIFLPFFRNFVKDDIREILDDYVKRQDVLEYFLWRVLDLPDEPFRIPESCRFDAYAESVMSLQHGR